MQVKDIMIRFPRTVNADDSIEIAAQIMTWAGVRYAPVLKQGALAGLLTERDLVAYQARRGESGLADRVEKVMRLEPVTARPSDDVAELATLMADHLLDCLPVMDDGSLAGVVTASEVLSAQTRLAQAPPEPAPETPTVRVADVMTRNPDVVHPDDYLLDAAGHMQQKRIRHLPVVDGERRVIGVLSDRDVRAAIGDPTRALRRTTLQVKEMRVHHAMSAPPITTEPERALSDVARDMVTLAAGAVPVTNPDGTLAGMLSYIDVLRGLVQR